MPDSFETVATDPAALPTVPPIAPQAGASPPKDVSGGPATVQPQAQLLERIERAADGAVAQHLAESTKKRHGDRGPDKRPRKRREPAPKDPVPVAAVGNSTASPLVEGPAPVPLESSFEPEPEAFDEEMAKAVVDVSVSLYQDLRESIVRRVAMEELKDPNAAAECVKSVALSERAEKALTLGGQLCAKKWSLYMAWAPEALLGAGLLLSLGQTAVVVKAIRVKGAELREKAA